MADLQLIQDLVLAVLAAFVGGAVAHRLGQPVLLGYLAGGMLIGPLTPGPKPEFHSVQVLAEIGVAFLMFALGAEFSLRELRRLGPVATVGGALQIITTAVLGPLMAPLLGLSSAQGLFLGAVLALSSTVVALKLLMTRGELQALHGRVSLGILLVQDVAVVPMAILLPALAVGGDGVIGDLGAAAAKAAGVLLGAYLLGALLVPRILSHAAIPHSRELFLLSIVALALGTAVVTRLAGLSVAFGAFLAGLVVAESEYRTQVLAEVVPLRDIFASLFFVSVGMLIDPRALLLQAGPVALLVGVTVLGKVAIVTALVVMLGLPGRVALLAAVTVAQVGEFSFVLARIGVDSAAVPPEMFSLILATAVVSILLAPFLLRASPGMLGLLERLPRVGDRFAEPAEGDPAAEDLRRHTVICGFGRVGRELADALERRGMRYLVIDYNPDVVREARARGVPVVYGDSGNPVVLDHAHLDRATVLALLIPDARAAEVATRYARARYPRLHIVARAAGGEQVERLQRAGASEVVQPEFEAGVEVIRHTLMRYGIGGPELVHLVAGRRGSFYRRASGGEQL